MICAWGILTDLKSHYSRQRRPLKSVQARAKFRCPPIFPSTPFFSVLFRKNRFPRGRLAGAITLPRGSSGHPSDFNFLPYKE
jgi:hypothetical protein